MSKDEIMKNKMKFHSMFKMGGKMELDDYLFSETKTIDQIVSKFSKYSGVGEVKEIIIRQPIWDTNEEDLGLFHYHNDGYICSSYIKTSRTTRLPLFIGAIAIGSHIVSSRLALDFMRRNLQPLYARLTAVDGFIPKLYSENFITFCSVYVSKHILGYKTDISETVYAYFLEMQKVVK